MAAKGIWFSRSQIGGGCFCIFYPNFDIIISMKIVSGTYGGRPLKTLEGKTTRPTSDKVRGAMFNMIGPYFDGGGSWIYMLAQAACPSKRYRGDGAGCLGRERPQSPSNYCQQYPNDQGKPQVSIAEDGGSPSSRPIAGDF